jgi:hypothetical protein
MHSIRLTGIVLAALLTFVAAFGASCATLKNVPAKVQLQVFDEQGRGQGYLIVKLVDPVTDKAVYQMATEENGNLMFEQVEAGEYKIVIADIGDNVIPSETKTIKVGAGRTVMETITIDRNATKTGGS